MHDSMRILVTSEPGSADRDNEDWLYARENLVAVLDGATARTDTGCLHGVTWYARRLGETVVDLARDVSMPLPTALAQAIGRVAEEHRSTCDLEHPGTPSAAIGLVRFHPTSLEYLVLGDVSLVVDQDGQLNVVSDDRVSRTAAAERMAADQHPIGSPSKAIALLAMKHAELAARNVPGGYWIAEADPSVAQHALIGTAPVDDRTRVAVLSDGAARAVTLGLLDWPGAVDLLCSEGPAALIARVRQAESEDPHGTRWRRNKRSDDATAVYVDGFAGGGPVIAI
ncbi:protein phosphatase 2C domain-containing protein [Micromonospora sp. CA-246542]|uniref:protein phosphatase 2C domain-containing protein n=1 Tax=Micromonospora sp. CA-246542 TaxID=3239959 RepID=UPI003D94AB65